MDATDPIARQLLVHTYVKESSGIIDECISLFNSTHNRRLAIELALMGRIRTLSNSIQAGILSGRSREVDIFQRIYYETCLTLRYIISDTSRESEDEFVRTAWIRKRNVVRDLFHSSDKDKEKTQQIKKQMLKRIANSAEEDGVVFSKADGKRPRSWHSNMGYEDFAEALGPIPAMNFAIRYAEGSASIHPSWDDMKTNYLHIEEADGKLKYKLMFDNSLRIYIEYNALICHTFEVCESYIYKHGSKLRALEIAQTHDSYHKKVHGYTDDTYSQVVDTFIA